MTPSRVDVLLERSAGSPPVRRFVRTRVGRRVALSPVAAPMRRRVNRRRLEEGIIEAGRSETASPAPPDASSRFDPSISPQVTTRFIVLAEGRSGSTLLVTELKRRWPEIRSRGEEFSRRRAEGRTFDEIVHDTFFPAGGPPIVGCKVLNGQVDGRQLREILALDGMRVIVLRRRSLLRRYVSERIAHQTDQWVGNPSRPPLTLDDRRITISPEHLYRRTMRSLAFARYCEGLKGRVQSIEVWYEDLATNMDDELRRIATFLGAGAPTFELPPRLQKQNPEPLDQLVTNLAEVLDFLRSRDLDSVVADEETPIVIDERDRTRSAWPTEPQLLLLRAAHGPMAEVEPNWNAWQADGRISFHDVEVLGSTLHRRLRHVLGPDAAPIDFRRHSAETTATRLLVRDRLDAIIDTLASDGIVPIVLDAPSIGLLAIDDPFLSNPPALNLAFPDDRFDAALRALTEAGWGIDGPTQDPSRPDDGFHDALLEEFGLHLRLRRRLLVLSPAAAAAFHDAACRDSTIRRISGRSIRLLHPSDELLCTLVHGIRHRPDSTSRWITDARTTIISSGADLDWDRMLERAHRFDVDDEVELAIDVLANTLPGLVPDAVPSTRRTMHTTEPDLHR